MYTSTRQRARAAAVLSATVVALLAGCGGGDPSGVPVDVSSTAPVNEGSTSTLPPSGELDKRHLIELQLVNRAGRPLDVVVRLTAWRTLRVAQGGPAMATSILVATGESSVQAAGLPHAATTASGASWQECTALLYPLAPGQALQATALSHLVAPAGTRVQLDSKAMVLTAEGYEVGDAPADGGCL